MPDKPYTAPKVSTLGTVAELTAGFNKNGPNADNFAQAPIVGSILTPAP